MFLKSKRIMTAFLAVVMLLCSFVQEHPIEYSEPTANDSQQM